MIALTLPGKSIFSPPSPSPPSFSPPPPPPTREDPAIEERRKKLRQSEAQRRGRGATLITGNQDKLGEPNVTRPEARSGASMLGQVGG